MLLQTLICLGEAGLTFVLEPTLGQGPQWSFYSPDLAQMGPQGAGVQEALPPPDALSWGP